MNVVLYFRILCISLIFGFTLCGTVGAEAPIMLLEESSGDQVMSVEDVASEPENSSPTVMKAMPPVAAEIEWGLWVDRDGCMHWWSDGGLEGFMVPRRNSENGKPVCIQQNTCAIHDNDVLFSSNSAVLADKSKEMLREFFASNGSFGYAVYGYSDSAGNPQYNQVLSHQRAEAVAMIAREEGGVVERVIGFGSANPVASNDTAEGRKKNRRVEIVCYGW